MVGNDFSSVMSQLPCSNLNDECRQILLSTSKGEVRNFYSSLPVDKTVLMSINYILCYSYPLFCQLTQKDISSPSPGSEGLLAYQSRNCPAHSFSTLPCLLSSSPVALFWHWNQYQKYHKRARDLLLFFHHSPVHVSQTN